MERQLTALEVELKTMLCHCAHSPREHDILRSIPSIGEVAAVAILVECPEIGTLGRKQAASLAGVAPMTQHSGK
ncbi:transposase [Octadecabacter antarcticus]|uniref:transposase n=1 Tax=Octadecabacter antarcticus TaxID=1217908 RepID=UPI0011818C97|nr:transposase [Octadecabacter antarcticus]